MSKNKTTKKNDILRIIIKAILHFLVIIVYRPKIINEDKIPKDEGIILCANHVHALDSAVIVLCAKRQICFMAKEELFKNKFIKWLADLFGVFPVKRGKQDIEAMKNSLKVLKEKKILGIFPEGTRNGLAKKVKVKSGAVYMAVSAGVKIVPVAVKGSFKPFTKVTVTYLDPIDYSYLKGTKPSKEQLDEMTMGVMEKIENELAK